MMVEIKKSLYCMIPEQYSILYCIAIKMNGRASVSYSIEKVNGVVIRKVAPYIQEFETFAKGRWLGRSLLEVLCTEFGAHPSSYWQNSIKCGTVKVNGKPVDQSYVLKNGDKFLHRTHRHEPPIFGEIELVAESEKLLAVCKPSSIPMHPCGAYRYNSLEYILRFEHLVKDQPILHVIHRLDRVTSGLVVLAKDKDTASLVSEEIRRKTTRKIYLARVKGRFPNLDRVASLPVISNVTTAMEAIDIEIEEELHVGRKKRKQPSNEMEVPEIVSKLSSEELSKFPNIGVLRDGQSLWVNCPIGVISHRDGVHACHPKGKLSLSQFLAAGYDNLSDTSLVVCVPFTGRTHQLRLHLEFLGNPIANDPCYGGELFYGDDDRKHIALDTMVALSDMGHITRSKIPHMNSLITGSNHCTEDVSRNESETDDDFLIRTCRYCKIHSSILDMEQSVHCDGIWLHALLYSGKNWKFRAPNPVWVEPFGTEQLNSVLKEFEQVQS